MRITIPALSLCHRETVLECHSEAQPKNLLLPSWRRREMLRFAQHDISAIAKAVLSMNSWNEI
jgi:hypothetical protein